MARHPEPTLPARPARPPSPALSHSSSGFRLAILTKTLLASLASCSLLAPLFGLRHALLPAPPHRLPGLTALLSLSAFSTSAELFFGAVSLYNLRTLERFYSTRKYIAFLAYSLVATAGLQYAACFALDATFGSKTLIPAGPHAIIFSALFMYDRRVPENEIFSVFGVCFSQKSLLYLVASQLSAAAWPHSVVPAFCGIVTGAFYSTNAIGIQSWRLPLFFERVATFCLSPFGSNPLPKHSLAHWWPASSPATATRPPAEQLQEQQPYIVLGEHVDFLVSSGFPRERAEVALRRANGNMNNAVLALLETVSQ